MSLELTEQQRQMVEQQAGRPVEVIDPNTRRGYMLIAREQFDRVRPMLDEPAPASAAAKPSSSGVSPAMLRSQQAYWRELPELLKKRKFRGRWVCYHGDERVGFARTGSELVQICLQRGWQRGDFYLGRVVEQFAPPWEPPEIEESLFEADDEFHHETNP